MTWKFVDARHQVAFRLIDGGFTESADVNTPQIQEFVAEGGVIEPSDEELGTGK